MAGFWDFWGSYGAYMLALAGMLVTFRPHLADGWRMWAWLGVFAVFGFLTSRGTQIGQQKLEAEITGGDSVVVFSIIEWPTTPQNGPWILTMSSTAGPVYDANIRVWKMADTPSRDAYAYEHPIFHKTVGTIMPVVVNVGSLALSPGIYGAQVIARNGFTYERLEIPKSGPQHQKYAVHKAPERVGVVCVPADYYWCDPRPSVP